MKWHSTEKNHFASPGMVCYWLGARPNATLHGKQAVLPTPRSPNWATLKSPAVGQKTVGRVA